MIPSAEISKQSKFLEALVLGIIIVITLLLILTAFYSYGQQVGRAAVCADLITAGFTTYHDRVCP